MKYYQGKIIKLKENQVFVFGANKQGFHGAGSAGYASFGISGNVWRQFDYANKTDGWVGKWNVKGKLGFQKGSEGLSYALQTVLSPKHPLKPQEIIQNIQELYNFANNHPNLDFLIAYDGKNKYKKNLNGYSSQQMASFFAELKIPKNVVFEENFMKLVKKEC